MNCLPERRDIDWVVEATDSFIKEAQHLLESIRSNQKICPKNKRRLKPTLITSFGLLSINENGLIANNTSKSGSQHYYTAPKSNHPTREVNASWSKLLTDSFSSASLPTLEAIEIGANLSSPTLSQKFIKFWKTIIQATDAFAEPPPKLAAPLPQLLSIFGPVMRQLLDLAPSLWDIPFYGNLFSCNPKKKTDFAPIPSTITDVDLECFPTLAYDDRRDSRGKSLGPKDVSGPTATHILHANQQKIRDLLHSWIREQASSSVMVTKAAAPTTVSPSTSLLSSIQTLSMKTESFSTTTTSTSTSTMSSLASSSLTLIQSILKAIKEENFPWFGALLLEEYLLIEGRRLNANTKLDRLEDRLTGKALSSNCILKFIEMADSFLLSYALRDQVFLLIETELQDPRLYHHCHRDTIFSYSILRIASLGRILAQLTRKQPGRYDDEVVCFMEERLLMAYQERHLLAILPLLHIWLVNCTLAIQHSLNSLLRALEKVIKRDTRLPIRNQTVMIWLLRMTINDDKDRTGDEEGSKSMASSFPPPKEEKLVEFPLDLKDNLPLERILTWTCTPFRDLMMALSTLHLLSSTDKIANCYENQDQNYKPTSLATPRKIRPIPQENSLPAATVLVPDELQRRLRHWFWWQHASFREFAHALIKYLYEAGYKLDRETAQLLLQVIPPLLPPILREESDMLSRVVALLLEQFKALIRN